ncbi:MAG TPA: Calx-beta domain-containing protein [Verrucomicrobiae bacterium]|nr:Calx-beta domain-containing protein [Verrucomicrobiae bacterium]
MLTPLWAAGEVGQADYRNQLYDGAPTNAPGTSLAEPASVAIYSGSIGNATNAATPNDGTIRLIGSAFGQPLGGNPLAFYLPGLSIASPTADLVMTAPATVTFSGQAWQLAFDEIVSHVDFYAAPASGGSATRLGSVTNTLAGTNNFQFTWTNDVLGNYVLTTVAVDNLGGATTSAPVNLSVLPVILVNGQYSPTHSFTFYSTNAIQVTMANPLPGGIVQYTVGGSDPVNGQLYTGPINVASSVFIRAQTADALGARIAEVDPVTITVIPVYTLSAGTLGGGLVTPPGATPWASNQTVNLSAAPSNGWTFLGWTGDVVTNTAAFNVTMRGNLNEQAVFGTTLSNAATSGGFILPSNSAHLYAYGSAAVLTAVPSTGNYLNAWLGAAAGISTNPLVFPITAPTQTVGAIFAGLPANSSALTLVVNGNGSVSRNPYSSFYATSQNVTIMATPSSNAVFTGWTGDLVSLQNPTVVSMASSKVITANFTNTPPGSPVFTLSSSAYSVQEDGIAVTLTVQKSLNSSNGSVNYSTSDGSAVSGGVGGGNYQATSGSLNFAAGDVTKTVSIPITHNYIYQGDTTFNFSLSAVPGSGSLGSPSVATVTIVEVDPSATTNSILAAHFPDAPQPSQGALQVFTQPASAQGQWRLLWEGTWHNSGDVISGLTTGNYPVAFSAVANFIAPSVTTNPVTSGSTAIVTNQYLSNGVASYGTLTVSLFPAGIGEWRLVGDATWRPSGYVIGGLVSGDHIVEFQPASGYVTPAPLVAAVGGGQDNAIAATYLVEEPVGASPPAVLQYSDATTAGSSGYPYVYNGQLLTDVGYGSGCVVQPRVVLTAGHMVFDDATLSYVDNIYWFFEEMSGLYNPPAATPAGFYSFSGYAAARTNDLAHGGAQGSESLASQNLDVAALYFLQDAGRGGSSGYLVSGQGTNWVQAAAQKVLVGYPVENVSPINVGRMHATAPSDVPFSLVGGNVYQSTAIIGYGGNSGGPLCVQAPNGTYYPAGVYLGGTANAIVREIDADAATLINDASSSAATGQNHAGGGVVTIAYSASGSTGFGSCKIVLQPSGAVAAGAGWKIVSIGGAFSADASVHGLAPGTYTLTFAPATNYVTPPNQVIKITANQMATITVTYGNPPPSAFFSKVNLTGAILTLSLATSNGQHFALERSTNLINWSALVTNTAASDGSLSFTNNTATNNGKAVFFRLRAVFP